MERFKEMTLKQFNDTYKLNYQGEMDIEKFTDYIESREVDYYYASYNHDDILSECKILCKELDRDFDSLFMAICVDGLYLALL